jgi:hypothetical protein
MNNLDRLQSKGLFSTAGFATELADKAAKIKNRGRSGSFDGAT